MTLNTALLIGGDASGALSAVTKTTQAINGLKSAAEAAQPALAPVLAPKSQAGVPALPTAAPSRAGSFNSANIAAQFQDIAVTTASGQSPLQIALQQGTQLSAVFDQVKRSGVSTGAAIAEAFGSILNPMSLVTIGAIAVGAAAVQWLSHLQGDLKTTSEALKDHQAAVKNIADAYGFASVAASKYSQESNLFLKFANAGDAAELEKQAQAAATAFSDAVSKLIPAGRGQAVKVIADRFQPFQDAINSLRTSAKAGEPDIASFLASVDRIAGSVTSLKGTGQELVKLVGDMRDIAGAMKDATQQGTLLAGVVQSIDRQAAGNVIQGSFGAIDAGKSAQRSALDLAAINARSPAQLAEIARKQKLLELDGQGLSLDRMRQDADQAAALAYAQASRTIAIGEAQRLSGANENLATARLDLAVIGESVGKTAELKFVREQLASAEQAAAQSGTTVSKAYRAEIEGLGVAYGKLQQSIAIGKLSSDVRFARDQLGRVSGEQDIASALRGIYGDDYASQLGGIAAAQLRVNESLSGLKDVVSDVTGGVLDGLKSDLLNSVGLFQTLGDVAANALAKIGDNLLSIATQNASTGIFNVLSGLFQPQVALGSGFTRLGIGHNAAGTDNWRGGLTAVNENGGEIINLPSGSQVIPHDVSMAMAQGGGQSVETTHNVTLNVNVTGAYGNSEVASMVKKGIQEGLKQYDSIMPERVKYIINNGRRRGAMI